MMIFETKCMSGACKLRLNVEICYLEYLLVSRLDSRQVLAHWSHLLAPFRSAPATAENGAGFPAAPTPTRTPGRPVAPPCGPLGACRQPGSNQPAITSPPRFGGGRYLAMQEAADAVLAGVFTVGSSRFTGALRSSGGAMQGVRQVVSLTSNRR